MPRGLASTRHIARSRYYKEPWCTCWAQARRNARKRRWHKRLMNKKRRSVGKKIIEQEVSNS